MMECFSHPGTGSVGVCKSCGKAVCRTCARDISFALVCSESCAREAAELHEINQRGKKLYGIGVDRKKLPSGVVMWLLFGTMFGGFGVYTYLRSGVPDWFLLIFGLACFVIAAMAYRRVKDLGLQC